jgi:DNA primase
MSVIDEVKQRVDIVDIISQYATLVKAGRNFRALCPFHSERNPSFYIYPEQQSWHCFGACNTGGDVFSFVMKQQNIDFGEAMRLLAQKTGVTIPSRSEPDVKRDKKERLYQINQAATEYFQKLLLNSPAGEKARNYLTERGISLDTILDFQLGFSPNGWEALKQHLMEKGYSKDELLEVGLIVATEDSKTHDRFRNKLMFPISDARGQITGFGARVLDDSLPKYINSPQTPIFDKSGSLYGINLAASAIRQQDLAIIVEGYLDVLTAHQNGFANVIASMGTSITDRQIRAIKRLTKTMALALDADAAGEEAMLRCVSYENSLEAEVRVVILPSDKDPDDVIKEDARAWQQLLDKTLPVMDYTFDMVTRKLDLSTARDKSILVERLWPHVLEIKDPIRQAHYVQKLARLAGVTERTIEATLSRRKTPRRTRESRQETVVHAMEPLHRNPLEEDCLTLLLQHPELKDRSEALLPEYFENSENREIFTTWQLVTDIPSLKEKLDIAIHEYLDSLISKSLPPARTEERYDSYVLRLREKYLRNLEARKAEVLASVAEEGGTKAELAKLEEHGIEPSIQLGEVFSQKPRRGQA